MPGPNNNVGKINIGGVSFNKKDVESSEKINKNGKQINSVWLKGGTNIQFPNQAAGNEAIVDTKLDKHGKIYGITLTDKKEVYTYGEKDGRTTIWYYVDGGRVPYNKSHSVMKTSDETFDEVKADFYRINGAKITGTEAEDRYELYGCRNTVVDMSQDDGNEDFVAIHPSDKTEGVYKSEHPHSSGRDKKSDHNVVYQNEYDTTDIKGGTATLYGKGKIKEDRSNFSGEDYKFRKQ